MPVGEPGFVLWPAAPKLHRLQPHGLRADTIQIAAGSLTDWPVAKVARALRMDFLASAIKSGGCPSSARLAGPISRADSTAASRPRPTAKSSERLYGSIAIPTKPAALNIACTRCSDANANGPGSSGPTDGSLGTWL